jgi:hypothetical protein
MLYYNLNEKVSKSNNKTACIPVCKYRLFYFLYADALTIEDVLALEGLPFTGLPVPRDSKLLA